MAAAAILVALGVADRLREQRRALSEAERRAETDPLTGVLNRRSLIERLEAGCTRAQARATCRSRCCSSISITSSRSTIPTGISRAMRACMRIVNPIQAELRQSDVIGRYGGEEFIVILSSASAAAAHPIAERIRERVACDPRRGIRPVDSPDVQHRRRGQRHAGRMGQEPHRPRGRGGLRSQALGAQSCADGGGAGGLNGDVAATSAGASRVSRRHTRRCNHCPSSRCHDLRCRSCLSPNNYAPPPQLDRRSERPFFSGLRSARRSRPATAPPCSGDLAGLHSVAAVEHIQKAIRDEAACGRSRRATATASAAAG